MTTLEPDSPYIQGLVRDLMVHLSMFNPFWANLCDDSRAFLIETEGDLFTGQDPIDQDAWVESQVLDCLQVYIDRRQEKLS